MRDLTDGLVTVIVPVYNTAPEYLKLCFDSVKNQTYAAREMIIVNDGSTRTETCEFCAVYFAENSGWCRLLDKPNQGVSAARGEGLSCACGEMTMFVDSDDTLMPKAVETMVRIMEQYAADAVVGEDYKRDTIQPVTIYDGSSTALRALLENKEASFGWALWAKLFKTELMLSCYKPRTDIFYGEDLLVNAEYFAACGRTVLINEHVYCYRKDNPDSAMKQSHSAKKLTLIRMWREMADIYGREGLKTEHDRIMANYYDSLLSGCLQCEYYRYDNYKKIMADIKGEIRKNMRAILASPYVSGKPRYVAAVNFIWVFKLKRKLKTAIERHKAAGRR